MNARTLASSLVLVVSGLGGQTALAQNDHFEFTTAYFGLDFGSVSADANFVAGSGSGAADIDSALAPSLAWGVKNNYAAFAFEYYQADFDINNFNANGTTQAVRDEFKALYYSGYWTPRILTNVHGIVGAGVGFGYQTVEGGIFDRAEDGTFTYKFTLGLEYYLFPRLSVYGTYEALFVGDAEDEARASDTVVDFEMNDFDLSRFAAGVRYYLR